MTKNFLKYQIIIFMVAALSAPMSLAYETTSNNSLICKYGVDNTSDKSNFFAHCDKCIYFYDADNLVAVFQIFLNPEVIQSEIANEEQAIRSLNHLTYQSRSPPSA